MRTACMNAGAAATVIYQAIDLTVILNRENNRKDDGPFILP